MPYTLKAPIFAAGADMKGAFALARGRSVFLIDGFGDMGDAENLGRYERAVKRYKRSLKIKPAVFACDLHPGYLSARFAEKESSPVKVQHHEAHAASCLAENGAKGRFLAVAFDGTGYGTDGRIWGGEFLIGKRGSFKRIGRLRYAAMPGSEKAIKEPWRMAESYLYAASGAQFMKLPLGLFRKVGKRRALFIKDMIDRGINCPMTSSAGRLFDAVSSMVLLKERVSYEAEAAIELERLASPEEEGAYPFNIYREEGMLVVDTRAIIRGVAKDLMAKSRGDEISSKFHNTLAAIIVSFANKIKSGYDIKGVALTGGVFQNSFLLGKTLSLLGEGGFNAITHRMVPANDSGIPLGQIVIADARSRCV